MTSRAACRGRRAGGVGTGRHRCRRSGPLSQKEGRRTPGGDRTCRCLRWPSARSRAHTARAPPGATNFGAAPTPPPPRPSSCALRPGLRGGGESGGWAPGRRRAPTARESLGREAPRTRWGAFSRGTLLAPVGQAFPGARHARRACRASPSSAPMRGGVTTAALLEARRWRRRRRKEGAEVEGGGGARRRFSSPEGPVEGREVGPRRAVTWTSGPLPRRLPRARDGAECGHRLRGRRRRWGRGVGAEVSESVRPKKKKGGETT